MINLLPPDIKTGYRYARRNVRLRRWLLVCLVALIGLGALTTYGLLRLHQSTTQYRHQIATTEQLFKQENLAGTQRQVQNINNSFRLVVKVLSQEILFASLLKHIGAIMPADTALTGLNITEGQPNIDVSAMATNYTAATQVQVNLADPANKIFSRADIESVSCGGTGSQNAAYPCTVTIRALFTPNNPFLFIHSKGTP